MHFKELLVLEVLLQEEMSCSVAGEAWGPASTPILSPEHCVQGQWVLKLRETPSEYSDAADMSPEVSRTWNTSSERHLVCPTKFPLSSATCTS